VAERQNRVVADMLRAVCGTQRSTWDQHIAYVQWSINSAQNRSIGMSPFCAQHGHEPRTRVAAMTGSNPQQSGSLSESLARIAYVQARADAMQQVAHNEAAAAYNAQRTPVTFNIDSMVLVHYAKRGNKLCSHWRGPYHVDERINDNFYTLRDLYGTLHRVHVSRMRPYDASRATEQDIEQVYLDDGSFLVDHIVRHRKQGSELQFFVSWVGFSDDQNTWEPGTSLIKTTAFQDYVLANNVTEWVKRVKTARAAAVRSAKKWAEKAAAAAAGRSQPGLQVDDTQGVGSFIIRFLRLSDDGR
jgi:hypothetical protein